MARSYWRASAERDSALVRSVTNNSGFPNRDFLAEFYAISTVHDLADLPFWMS
jgi:hypothetical protein